MLTLNCEKGFLTLFLVVFLFGFHAPLVFGFLISPNVNRLVFQDIKSLEGLSVKYPASGYFRIDNVKPYVNLYAYSNPYNGTIEFKKYPLVSTPDYPIEVSTDSDAVEICGDTPYQCVNHIDTSLSKSTIIWVKLTDVAVNELKKNPNAVSDFQIRATIDDQTSIIIVSVDRFGEFDRGVPEPYDYYNLPYPWNLITQENLGKLAFIAIIIPTFLISLVILHRKNDLKGLLPYIKFLILVIASYLPTVTLIRYPDTKLSYKCSWTGYYGSHEWQGLPIPHQHPNLFIFSLNYWFWILGLMVLVTFLSRNKFENESLNLKNFLKRNKYFFILALIYYLLFKIVSTFLEVTLMC